MSARPQILRSLTGPALGCLTFAFLVAGTIRPTFADDTKLLRTGSNKPYLFILFDTSTSMTRSPAGGWLQADGDDRRSKLYSAKKVIYEVMKDTPDVQLHFGFGTFNQNQLRVRAKHWLYYTEEAPAVGFPLAYPDPWEAAVEVPVGTPVTGSTPTTPASCWAISSPSAPIRFRRPPPPAPPAPAPTAFPSARWAAPRARRSTASRNWASRARPEPSPRCGSTPAAAHRPTTDWRYRCAPAGSATPRSSSGWSPGL
jgi:hypothetical protein